jgi:hypothetical protein
MLDKTRRAVSDLVDKHVQVQERVLRDIESGDEAKMKAVKELLRQKIEEDKKQVADWRAALGK